MSEDANLTDTLLRTVDRIAEDHATRAVREAAERGEFPVELWAALEDVGLPRAWLHEDAGGAGLSVADAMLALRRSAYHALPVPLAETLVAGRLLAEAGIALPDGPLTLASAAPGATPVALSREDEQESLVGTAERVPWARDCSHAVLAAVDGAESFLVLAAIGNAVGESAANLASEPRCAVALDAARVVALAPMPGAAERILLEGALARSMQMAGALEAAMDIALRYSGERIQFGRPIAKFQAVQHMLAMMAGHVATARAAADQAIEADAAMPSALRVAIAKSRTGEAAGRGAETVHQVLGAIGFTREHSLHYQTRRLWSWRDEFGGETYWQQRLGREVARLGADALWPTIVDI
ncbi:MAG: acyl-CoA dehydrogenase family protein [Burkholderiaceae bacterium]